ncbi:hypothetical protein SAMN05216525_13464 [Bradyrhizobium sp. Gha]|nr:hypothetical protein SAMN05216525_13464 [Bradyrhizobium sp. Gha]
MHRCLVQPAQNGEPPRSLSTVGLPLSKDSGRCADLGVIRGTVWPRVVAPPK